MSDSEFRVLHLEDNQVNALVVRKMLEAAEMERLMQAAIAELDEEHRLLVILRDVEEMSYQEIGEITGLPEGTIKSRLHRARMAIKEYLDKHTK